MSANIDIEQAGSTVAEVRMFISNLLKNQNQFSQSDIAEINAIMKLRSARQMKNKFKELLERIDSNSLTFDDEDEDKIDASINNEPEEEQTSKVQEIIKEVTSRKSLREITDGHKYELYSYHKKSWLAFGYPNNNVKELRKKYEWLKVTGYAWLHNESPEYAEFDIDFTHNIPADELARHQSTAKAHFPKNCKEVDVTDETGNHGYHFVCINDVPDKFFTNRNVGLLVTDDYTIDVFVGVEGDSPSQVVLPGSQTQNVLRTEKIPGREKPIEILDGITREYKFLYGDWDRPITRKLSELMELFEVPYPKKPVKKEHVKTIVVDDEDDFTNFVDSFAVPENVLPVLVDGIKDFKVHGATEKCVAQEASLMPLCQSINCISNKEIRDRAYTNLQKCFTDSAEIKFEDEYEKNRCIKSSLWWLYQCVMIHNHDYYVERLYPLLCTEKKKTNDIDTSSPFMLEDFMRNCNARKYEKESDAVKDMIRIFRYCQHKHLFIQKYQEKYQGQKVIMLKYVPYSNFVSDMETSVVYAVEKKNRKHILTQQEESTVDIDTIKYVTMFDLFKRNKLLFHVNGITFIDNDSDYISIFHGYEFDTVTSVDMDILADYLKLIKEGICDNDEKLFDYVIKWMAYVIQNPGKKTGIPLVLQGLEGCGKNTFSDIFSNLIGKYGVQNISKIDHITGQFNAIIEFKMLLVCNELKSIKDEYIVSMDALKTVISDPTIVINDKHVSHRVSENVANIIFISNNAKPVIVKASDRRYCVIRCSPKFIEKFDFFENLHDMSDEFYMNLLTYLKNIDLKGFNVRKIPMTSAREDLIVASLDDYETFMVQNFDDLVQGITSKALKTKWDIEHESMDEESKKKGFKAFMAFLRTKCYDPRATNIEWMGKRTKGYKLLDEVADKYKQCKELVRDNDGIE